MKRYNQTSQGSSEGYRHPDDPFFKDYPEVARFMTDAWWEDGKPREVCSLTFRAGSDNAHVSLNDKENDQNTSNRPAPFRGNGDN